MPDDPEERAERLARLRRVGVGAAAAVVACLMVYTVFPVRTALNLWEAEDRARERQAAFERENEILEDEIADLQSDERIEVEAREQGMVMPGEESYGIMPAPAPVPGRRPAPRSRRARRRRRRPADPPDGRRRSDPRRQTVAGTRPPGIAAPVSARRRARRSPALRMRRMRVSSASRARSASSVSPVRFSMPQWRTTTGERIWSWWIWKS